MTNGGKEYFCNNTKVFPTFYFLQKKNQCFKVFFVAKTKKSYFLKRKWGNENEKDMTKNE